MLARSPLVTQVLVPLTIHSSPSRVTRHEMLRVSVPASGSESERAPRFAPAARSGSHRCFWASVPKRRMFVAHIVCVLMIPDRLIQPYDELLDDPDVREEVEAEAAVLLGDGDPEEAELLHLLDHRVGIRVGVLEVRRHRDHITRDEAAHGCDHFVANLRVSRHPVRDGTGATQSRPGPKSA